ncbi:hypothetical protein TNCT_602601 [Trichonephila clavata]|uniref:Uncharacterized protein n=1 Tax=Trichonephila clavata TaxID=2740835 RepID=A0A8X6KCG7_TRICU|nr:hypothetical protein TNCT_602601 [Trichonephila clavata]
MEGRYLVWRLFMWTEIIPLIRVTWFLTGYSFIVIFFSTMCTCLCIISIPLYISLQQNRIVSEWFDEHFIDMTSFPRPSRLPYLNPRAYLRYGVERDVQCEMWETVEKAGLTSINQQQQDHVLHVHLFLMK